MSLGFLTRARAWRRERGRAASLTLARSRTVTKLPGMSRGSLLALALGALLWAPLGAGRAQAQRLVEISFVPTERAQIAVWIERADGTYVQTLRLTEATAYRGIGNRPGALQMNSGFHWPYGRREGVLPVWAHRRAAAQGYFPRVIFQDRASEGFASRTSNDASPDNYFCLSFSQETTSRDALDAVTCASQFNSDKGRYVTDADVARGYAEPFEAEGGTSMEMRPLGPESLYPPRRDLTELRGSDHEDILAYADDARRVMPEIDAVTMATPPGAMAYTYQFNAPSDWEDGDYVLFVEVNVEGDYNESWNDRRFPTPQLGGPDAWDFWAKTYGYAYRGQPSVVYAVPFRLDPSGGVYEAVDPVGYGALHGEDGELRTMDGTITDDTTTAPGSGADRLLEVDGKRVTVRVVPSNVCGSPEPPPECFQECDAANPCADGFVCSPDGECVGLCDLAAAPAPVAEFTVVPHEERSWDQAHVSFVVPASMRTIGRYEVRVATTPLQPGMAFGSWGTEAKIAGLEDIALVVPTDAPAGSRVEVDLGHLMPQTHYYVGVRAVDSCNSASEVAMAELTTTEIIFTTVTPCFVATAAYGSPMAAQIGALRRFRDRYLLSNGPGRALVEAYYEHGPAAADVIRRSPALREVARAVLAPAVWLARWIDD